MKKILSAMLITAIATFSSLAQNSIYDFTVMDAEGNNVNLEDYKGKVILIVNTASRCGFTPQYKELEQLYKEFAGMGFEILDFPCNQFGEQAPESDADYVKFCQAKYDIEFKQFHKIDVNGDNAIPLFTYLKEKQGFKGLDKGHPLTKVLEKMFDKNQPDWRESSDIKWNFTKFLVDAEGNVVARFEPTATSKMMRPEIIKLLNK